MPHPRVGSAEPVDAPSEPPGVGRPEPAALLAAWERAAAEPLPVRALALLEAALGPSARDVPVGERDRLLLELRRLLFGPRLACAASCASCGTELELEFSVDDVLVPRPPARRQPPRLRHAGRTVRFRAPTAGDAADAARVGTPEQAQRALLRRCAPGDGLPPGAVERLERRIVDLDPQVEIELRIACPDCCAQRLAPFDVPSQVWAEVDAWARRTLWMVHELACAYGWGEAEVLSLGPQRQQFYLSAVHG